MADKLTKERRSWNMSRIRGQDTGPEKRLRSLLHRAGLRYRLHAKDLPGKPDIVLPKYATAVFVHGCFWHRHPGCPNCTMPSTRREFWEKKFNGNVERDARNVERLKAEGWNVLTVWECELRKNEVRAADRVIARLRERR